MPLIDLKSELSIKRQVATIGNSAYAAAQSHVDRLVELLTSSKGAEFAAKQAILDPATALRRLAAITRQVNINPLGIANKGKGIQSVFNQTYNIPDAYGGTVSRTPPISSKYYHNKNVKADIDSRVYIDSNNELTELDIVPFYFTTYNLNNGQVEMGPALGFRSFFSSIQDSVTGNWSGFSYTGRGEMLYVFNNRGRSVNFTFKTAAFNYDQLLVMHQKVNTLKSFASPTYNESGYMQGNFFKLTIGDVVKDVPGIITGVSVTVADNIPWEVGERSSILPHVLDVSVQFTVLENKTPQFSQPTIGTTYNGQEQAQLANISNIVAGNFLS